MVPTTRIVIRLSVLQLRCRHLVCRVHFRGAYVAHALSTRRKRHGSAKDDIPCTRHADRRGMAGMLLALKDVRKSGFSRITSQGHTKLPDYVSIGQFPKTPLRDLFTAASADTLNLLSKCITYEPRKRISARDVCTFLGFTTYLFVFADQCPGS